MKRRIILMRHAKSSHGDITLSDHQRPLDKRGWRQSKEIAHRLVDEGWSPELVVSSDALRTKETWQSMESAFDPTPAVRWDENLYLAGPQAICESLFEVDRDIQSVLLLGHNPGWEQALGYFSGERHSMSTSNAAVLEAEADTWDELLHSNTFNMVVLLRPTT